MTILIDLIIYKLFYLEKDSDFKALEIFLKKQVALETLVNFVTVCYFLVERKLFLRLKMGELRIIFFYFCILGAIKYLNFDKKKYDKIKK